MFGVDYAWGFPGVKALKAAKVGFVCRYLSHDASKNLRANELLALRKAGIDVVVVWEAAASRALAGSKAGAEDAQAAEEQLFALGAPANSPVYFAVDFDATAAEVPAINAYLQGAASILGKDRVGVYASISVVKAALDAGVCKYAWQTYAWSAGKLEPRAHLYQFSNGHSINGVSVDYDRSLQADFGQMVFTSKPHPFYDWLSHVLGEGKYKGHPKDVAPAKPGWWKRAAKFLIARKNKSA